MPLLFSYGTLQEDRVQLATFGRLLHGQRDELVGAVLSEVRIENPAVAAAAGRTHFDNVKFPPGSDSCVRGMRFELTDAELHEADRYEQPAGYVRVKAFLLSGAAAWVYVDARTVRISSGERKT